jgi:hypothetical protein
MGLQPEYRIGKKSTILLLECEKMFIAKPKITNWIDSKEFKTAKLARKYLEEYNDMKMPLKDWIQIGKLIEKTDENVRV